MTTADGAEFFGPGYTWTRLWDRARRLLSEDFPWKSDEAIDEAVTEGWLYVKGYWFSQKATRKLGERKRWPFAMRTLLLRARSWLAEEAEREDTLVPVSAIAPEGASPEEYNDWLDRLYGPTTDADPEDLAAERDLAQRANRVIAALRDTEEWEPWAEDLLEGLTQREAAEKRGVSQSTIHRRQRDGLNRIRPLLAEHGLNEEAS